MAGKNKGKFDEAQLIDAITEAFNDIVKRYASQDNIEAARVAGALRRAERPFVNSVVEKLKQKLG